MPRRKTSIATQRSNVKKQRENSRVKQQLKKSLKKLQALVSTKNLTEAKTFISNVCSQLDKAAKKHIIHPKTASRKKSRLMKRLAKTA